MADLKAIIEQLQQRDWRIVVIDHGGYDGYSYELRGPSLVIDHTMIQRLAREGWITGFPNGQGFQLSDEGRKAYLKSTDELGDGKLIPPLP